MRKAKANSLNPSAKVFCVLTTALAVSACSTMRFHNEPSQQTEIMVASQWHHTAINGMVEISRPANLRQMCAGEQWHSIKVESTWINQLIPLGVKNPPFVSLYNPWTITAQCTYNAEEFPELQEAPQVSPGK